MNQMTEPASHKIAKALAKPLSRALANRVTGRLSQAAESYLSILLGKGGGHGLGNVKRS